MIANKTVVATVLFPSFDSLLNLTICYSRPALVSN